LAFDDPIVWVLIVAVVVFLFGSTKIPGIARALGQARREFDLVSKSGLASSAPHSKSADPSITNTSVSESGNDPLIVAAQGEGIETEGKSKKEIASELSWKLKNN
jgi:sec-independent protein translocase protein TatA